MKPYIKKITILITLIFTLSLILMSCNTADKDLIKIGVVQLVEHEALDEAYRGFVDEMAENGFVDGKTIKIDFNNAQGNPANATTIANKLVSQESDLILAIATPAVLAVKTATADSQIPVIFSAVTDAAQVGIIDSNEKPGGNITGASDMTPVAEQIALLKDLYPDAKKIGLLYSSGEVNSVVQIEIAKEAAANLGLEVVEFTFSNTNEVTQVVEDAVTKVDAIYSPTDNNVATTVSNIVAITNENKIPFIVGESSLVDKGALATFGIDYYELGKLSAKQAIKVLETKDAANTPVEHLEDFTLIINGKTAEILGLKVPDKLLEFVVN